MSTDHAPMAPELSRRRSPPVPPGIVLPASCASLYDAPPDRLLMGLAHLMSVVNYGLVATWMFQVIPNLWHIGAGLLTAVGIGAIAESLMVPLLHVCLGSRFRFSEPLALWMGRGVGAFAGAFLAWWL